MDKAKMRMLPRATKTQLARLIKAVTGLMPSKSARFKKAFRDRAWWMEWEVDEGWYTVFFSVVIGQPFLLVTTPEESKKTYDVSIDQLVALNMVEYRERKNA